MKVKALVLTLVAATALTACHKEEHVKAVDKLEEAQAMALEKAPKAEEMKFDDHGQKPFAEVKTPAASADTASEAPAETAETEESTK